MSRGPLPSPTEHGNFLDLQIGFLALHLCIVRANLLVNGCSTKRCGMTIAPDLVAAGDCPFDPNELSRVSQRVERIRDQIMHLPDGLEPGRTVNLDARRGTPSALATVPQCGSESMVRFHRWKT